MLRWFVFTCVIAAALSDSMMDGGYGAPMTDDAEPPPPPPPPPMDNGAAPVGKPMHPEKTGEPATAPSGACEDKHEMCCFWAWLGECNTNSLWMRPNCQKSCGTCGCTAATHADCKVDDSKCRMGSGTGFDDDKSVSQTDCSDQKEDCCAWAAAGECDKNPFWMRTSCAKACGTCGCEVKNALACVVTVDASCKEGAPAVDKDEGEQPHPPPKEKEEQPPPEATPVATSAPEAGAPPGPSTKAAPEPSEEMMPPPTEAPTEPPPPPTEAPTEPPPPPVADASHDDSQMESLPDQAEPSGYAAEAPTEPPPPPTEAPTEPPPPPTEAPTEPPPPPTEAPKEPPPSPVADAPHDDSQMESLPDQAEPSGYAAEAPLTPKPKPVTENGDGGKTYDQPGMAPHHAEKPIGNGAMPAKEKQPTPAGCVDADNNCPTWADQGECEKNPFWMLPNCQKSCNSCGKTVADVQAPAPKPGCDNKNELCQFWSTLGECDKNSVWMHPNCALSCGKC